MLTASDGGLTSMPQVTVEAASGRIVVTWTDYLGKRSGPSVVRVARSLP